MLTAQLRDRGKTISNLNALNGVNAHHGMGNIGIEAVKYRLTPSGGYILRYHIDARADRVTLLDQILHIAF